MKLLTNKSSGNCLKLALWVSAFFLLWGNNLGAQSNCERLVWQDEFDGTALDLSKWDYELGDGCPALCQWGTGQLDYSRKENVTVANGKLTLAIKKENFGGREYTSGRIRTYKKANFRYGRIEARVKGVDTQGNGFAFWMLGSSFETTSWPKCGEIDIFEQTGKFPDMNIGTTHYQESYGHAWNQGKIYLPNKEKFANEFHTVGLEWTPDSMSWYMDGKYYHTFHIKEPINGYDPFNRDFFLILSVGMGGEYSGAPDGTTITPQNVEVEYVRVYEGKQHIAIEGDRDVYEGDQKRVYLTKAQPGATYTWSVPTGATIVSGQGTNKIEVNFGSASGKVTLTETLAGCTPTVVTRDINVQKAIVVDQNIDDFENNRNCVYGGYAGTFTQVVDNPGANGFNSSAKVGKYVRNVSEAWDYLIMNNVNIGHAGEFAQGKKRFFMDVYTDAPVGTKVSLGLENSLVATPSYPYGKHSNYAANTTAQGAWQRLEFKMTDIPDKYTGSYKVDKIVMMFDPGIKSGNTWYFDNLRTGQSGADAPILSKTILEDCEGNSTITLRASNGTYAKVGNPSATGINTTPNVIKYTRNGAEKNDQFSYKVQIDDASVFRDGTNTVSFDVYTTAPAGKVISLHFEDSTIVATSANWEAPMHSIYEGRIEKSGSWQTVEFKWASTPNASLPNVSVNKLVFLIDENTNNSDVYFIDNIRINSRAQVVSYVPKQMIHDYKNNWNLEYVYFGEEYAPKLATDPIVANPAPTGINTSAEVGKAVRNVGAGDDWLVFNLKTPIDAKALKNKSMIVAADVYSNAPAGKTITLGLEAGTLATSTNWPTGRHSDYATATKTPNQWNTLKFIYSSSADGSTPDNLVDKLIFTFNQGQAGNYTYYIDNIRVMELVKDTVLYTIDVTPTLSQNVALNQTIQFTAAGKDQFGKPFASKPTWSVTGGGTISSTGLFRASTNGVYKVMATDGTVSGSADILIGESIKLSKIVMSPSTATIYQGQSTQLTASGYDQLSKPIAIPSPVYTIAPATGASINNGLFTSNTPGEYTVTITSGSVIAKSVITVRATPVLTTLSISPLATQILLNGTQQFAASTLDQYGNSITVPVTWSAAGANITSSGLFSAGAIGTYVVKVQAGSLQASTYISVLEVPQNVALNKPVTYSSQQNDGLAARLANDGDAATRWASNETDAEWITVDLQQTYKLSSIVLNWEAAYGKVFEIKGSTNGTDFSVIASETNGGAGKKTYNVNAKVRYIRMQGITRGTIYGYSLYEIEAYGVVATTPALKAIVVTPGYTEVDQNTTQAFTFKAFDQFGDAFAVTPSWGTTGGSINGSGVYTASTVGTFNVTATSGSVSGSAQIKVKGNALPTVSITSPANNYSVVVGTNVDVVASASDSDGSISNVEIFVDGQSRGVKTAAPYSVSVAGLAVGTHSITAVATDNMNATTTSSAITISVTQDGGGETNIALNKPASSSSFEGGMPASSAVDGNMGTRWGSEFSDLQWIAVDFQGNFNINRVVLKWETASGKAYTIETSSNGTTWASIRTVTAGAGGTETFSFTGVTAKYIRINGTQRNTGYGYSLWELEVYGTPAGGNIAVTGVAVTPASASVTIGSTVQLAAAISPANATNQTVTWSSSNSAIASVSSTGLVTGVAVGTATITATTQDGGKTSLSTITVTQVGGNLALNKPAVATSTQAGLLLANVNDGNNGTRWGSEWTDLQSVTIDLQANYTISKVVLNWEGACGKNYTVDVSADNNTWTTIYSTTSGVAGINTITPTVTASGRYIRMNGTLRATGWGYSIWEFEVYGTSALKSELDAEPIAQDAKKEVTPTSFYPNPVEDILTINVDSEMGYSNLFIFNLTGKLVAQRAIDTTTGSVTVDFSQYAKGTYLVKLIGNDKTEVIKVVK